MKITVIGAGAFGKALGQVLSENKHEVLFYDPILKNELSDVLNGAEAVLLTVPSQAIENVINLLPLNVPLIVATKGILNPDIFHDFEQVMALSGPGFAKDIVEHKNTRLTATDTFVGELFETSYLKFDYSDDLKGVFLCGALKNIYAIGAGLRELIPDTPEMDDYISCACKEMSQILEANGAHAETTSLSCGIYDLRLTCSYDSRNFDFGLKASRNPDFKPAVLTEGITTLLKIHTLVIPNDLSILISLIRESSKWV